jgi:hypothetical protein
MSERIIHDNIREEGEAYFGLIPERLHSGLPLLKHAFYSGAMCAVLLALKRHHKSLTAQEYYDLLQVIVNDIHNLSEEALAKISEEDKT